MARTPDVDPPAGRGRDGVAIVGGACRLPGAPDVAAFWDLLVGGRAGDREDHLPAGGVHGGAVAATGGPDGRSEPVRAVVADALADAELREDDMAGRRAGLWVVVPAAGAADRTHGPRAVAAQVAHGLRMRGPSLDLTEAGTTSLLGVHLGCRALWAGETDLAVVVAGRPPDERTGETCGTVAVVLKRLSQARRDGDRVYAAIVGSALANGRAAAASALGRQATLSAAYRDAGVSPGQVDYVEVCDMGAAGGDAELTALARVLRAGRRAEHPCVVGTAAGDLADGPASGLAGLLKTVLALWHRQIPGSDAECPAAAGATLEFASRLRPWPGDGPGLAGVGSSGRSGVGVHVVLTGPPAGVRTHSPEAYLLPLSAPKPEALRALAGAYADALEADAAPDPLDVCATAGARQAHHDHRMAVVASGGAELAAALRSPADHPDSVTGDTARPTAAPRVVFVFPGQGAHWEGMVRGLLRSSPVFARRLGECARAVEAELGWSPADRLMNGGRLSAVDEVQPTVWAVQVALTDVWRDWGIEPDVVIGHSMGEIAAATAAGALTLEDAAAVVCRRGRIIRSRAVPGAMWAVRLTERQAREAIGEHADQVCAGVLNGETSIVLSGDPDALGKVTGPLLERGVFCRRVKVDYASHAPQVETMRADLLTALAGVRPRSARVRMHSTAWDRPVDGTELGAAYWMDNLRLPVRFGSAVRSVLADHVPTVFIEVSAHPLLVVPVQETIAAAGAPAVAVASLYRKRPDLGAMLTGLGAAYATGCDPDWSRVHHGGRPLPPPFPRRSGDVRPW